MARGKIFESLLATIFLSLFRVRLSLNTRNSPKLKREKGTNRERERERGGGGEIA